MATQAMTNPIINTIYGIGRNYALHAYELGNVVESEPVVFLKPNSSINWGDTIALPEFSNAIHHEVELVLLMGEPVLVNGTISQKSLAGYGIGIDLTARDVQDELKARRLPWTLAKGFKGASVLTKFLPMADLGDIRLQLWVNDELRQDGNSSQMIYNVDYLLQFLHRHFGLQAGDVIFTGTPEGVGKLSVGDRLKLGLNNTHFYQFNVV